MSADQALGVVVVLVSNSILPGLPLLPPGASLRHPGPARAQFPAGRNAKCLCLGRISLPVQKSKQRAAVGEMNFNSLEHLPLIYDDPPTVFQAM